MRVPSLYYVRICMYCAVLYLVTLEMKRTTREEENASNQRQKKRDAEEADKVEVAPGVTVASLRRFRTALIGPTQGLPKRRRLCH